MRKNVNKGIFQIYIFKKIEVQFLHLNPDPDQATQINAGPCGSGSTTLLKEPTYVFSISPKKKYVTLSSK
jgi:hypothetical protein